MYAITPILPYITLANIQNKTFPRAALAARNMSIQLKIYNRTTVTKLAIVKVRIEH